MVVVVFKNSSTIWLYLFVRTILFFTFAFFRLRQQKKQIHPHTSQQSAKVVVVFQCSYPLAFVREDDKKQVYYWVFVREHKQVDR